MSDLQIQCFLEVAECLNFSKAAKHLYVSQSYVSRQISSLEEELDLVLFRRNTKSVKLTEQGRLLSDTLKEILVCWRQAVVYAKKLS